MNPQLNEPSDLDANSRSSMNLTTDQTVPADADADGQGEAITALGAVRVRWRGRVVTGVELAPRASATSPMADPGLDCR